VNHLKVKKIVINIFKNFKLKEAHAEISAEYLIKAELLGAPSHGLSRLKMYCERLNKKIINPNPKIKIKKISQSISHIDANNSIGFVAADLGIKIAIKNAKKTGIGLVAIKNSGHYGLSSFYAEQAVIKKINGLSKIARNRGQTVSQLAIAWILRHKTMTSALIGSRTVKQLNECLDSLKNLKFTKSELKQIDKFAKEEKINLWEPSSRY